MQIRKIRELLIFSTRCCKKLQKITVQRLNHQTDSNRTVLLVLICNDNPIPFWTVSRKGRKFSKCKVYEIQFSDASAEKSNPKKSIISASFWLHQCFSIQFFHILAEFQNMPAIRWCQCSKTQDTPFFRPFL